MIQVKKKRFPFKIWRTYVSPHINNSSRKQILLGQIPKAAIPFHEIIFIPLSLVSTLFNLGRFLEKVNDVIIPHQALMIAQLLPDDQLYVCSRNSQHMTVILHRTIHTQLAKLDYSITVISSIRTTGQAYQYRIQLNKWP